MGKFNLKSYFTFLSRNKAYTAVNVFGLAVSLTFVIIIGLYTWQEFSIDHQHSKAKRIYNIGISLDNYEWRTADCHHVVLRYLRSRYPEIEQTCGFTPGNLKLKDNGDFVNIYVLQADSTFFSMFDFPLLQGNRANCLSQKGNIVLTESAARRLFGDEEVVGRTLTTADNTHFRITGVVKDFDNTIIDKDIQGVIDFSFCTNLANKDEYFPSMVNMTSTSSFVQVREGCDFAAKQKDVDDYFQTFFNVGVTGLHPIITRLDKLYFSGLEAFVLQMGNPILVKILFAVGIAILLFSIMNYVNLTVAQSGYRAREMATRRLFGCTRGTVGVNMFTESLVMCVISLLIAVAFACVCTPYASQLLDKKLDISLLASPQAVGIMLAFILLVSLAAGALPATILSRVKPIEVVRGTFRKHTKMIFSRVFITVQNIITIVMLACAVIMSLQMLHLIKAPLGFNTENILSIEYPDEFSSLHSGEFEDRLRSLPFVKAVAPSYGTPATGGNNKTVTYDEEKREWSFQFICGTPEMMKIYGLTLKNDLHAKGDSIVYLNDMALEALQMKPTDRHLSKRYKEVRYSYFGKEAQFGGILNDFRIRNILEEQHPLLVQVCNKIKKPWNISILVSGDPIEAYAKIKEVYKEVFHEDIDESGSPFVDKFVQARFEQELRTTKIVSLFAVIAIIISLLGLVAMSTYFIQQRAREIAIRKVFGSTGNQIRLRLIRTFMLYVGIAFVIAVPIVVHFMSKWIEQYSYRIVWWPWIVAAGAIVMLISFAAVAVQSWMASNENPVKNIRQE